MCDDCPATSDETFIHVDDRLCLDCREERRLNDA